MEKRAIGDSGLMCSALGFGTWEIMKAGYGQTDVQHVSAAINAAIDSGVTLFDTAEIYGPFYSEEVLGAALGRRRKDIVLVTKVGFVYDDERRAVVLTPGGYELRDAGRQNVLSRVEGCLRRLQTDWIDLLLIHWPDAKTPCEETIGALETLKAAGKIRSYGVSNYTVPMMEECQKHGHIVANQIGYHLFDRRMEAEVLPYCLAHHIGFMTYGTLAFGLLSGAFTPDTTFPDSDWRHLGIAFYLPLFKREHFLKELRVVERLKGLAAGYGKSVAQLAIAWVLGHPAVSVALVGMRNPRELAENVAAGDWKLTAADRAEIDRIFAEEAVPTYADAPQVDPYH